MTGDEFEGGITFDTDSPLGGNTVWIPAQWMQRQLKQLPADQLRSVEERLTPIVSNFFSVLSTAAMAGARSEELLAKLEASLDEAGRDILHGGNDA